jgi:hypothetical protein
MAITANYHFLIRGMFERGLLPTGAALLEIGEANWYGDLDPRSLVDDIKKYVADPQRRDALIQRLSTAVATQGVIAQFDVVKIFYEIFFSPTETVAVDFQGTPAALRLDLNGPIELGRRFDVVINHGTAEHIFNIAQVFKTMHDYTVPGGLMIHESPFTGWIDHGFYSVQPTLYFDLASRNGYEVRGMFIEGLSTKSITTITAREDVHELAKSKLIPENSTLFTVLKRGPEDLPFQVPLQGYYARTLSETEVAAWKDLR